MTSRLFIMILVLFWSNNNESVAQEDNAFTLLFGSESSLLDIVEDVDEIKTQLVDAIKGSADLQEECNGLIRRFEKLESTLTNQDNNFLKKLESFLSDNLDFQSRILAQQLKTDQQFLLDKMATLQMTIKTELQQSEVIFLDGLKKSDT